MKQFIIVITVLPTYLKYFVQINVHSIYKQERRNILESTRKQINHELHGLLIKL